MAVKKSKSENTDITPEKWPNIKNEIVQQPLIADNFVFGKICFWPEQFFLKNSYVLQLSFW